MGGTQVRRRRVVASAVAAVVLVGAGATVAARSVDGSAAEGGDGEDAGETTGTATAEVTRRDLEERAELSGTLGYGEQSDVALAGGGTVTALPALGTIVDRGQTLVEVDGRAVTLWFGERPLWRPLDANATDGADVEEVEANLVALGFATATSLTVDETWTDATTQAVKRWQRSLDRDETGAISPGDVVVLPAAVRIAGHPTPVGGGAGGPVATVTGATRRVTVDLEATKQALVTAGQAVEVELPDGTVVAGTVASVGTVAVAGEGGDPLNPADPTITVTVALEDATQAGTLDEAPVTVRVTTSAAEGVLAVPVDALLALAEGGYAVERVLGTGGTELVPVEAGAFADGWVEVTGDVAEGDVVVVPA